MKVTLLHPSYGRPQQAKQAYDNWINKASYKNSVEHILSVDKGDPHISQYLEVFNGITNIVQNDTDNVVAATNHAAKSASGDILIYISDDFDCPENWDVQLIQIINSPLLNIGTGNTEVPGDKWCIEVNDGYQTNRNLLTIPIMSRGLYNELGYFWYPEYRSMFCDNDLYELCKQTHKVLYDCFNKITFQHNHYCNGRAVKDATYTRSEGNWNQGLSVFNRRSKEHNWGKHY